MVSHLVCRYSVYSSMVLAHTAAFFVVVLSVLLHSEIIAAVWGTATCLWNSCMRQFSAFCVVPSVRVGDKLLI